MLLAATALPAILRGTELPGSRNYPPERGHSYITQGPEPPPCPWSDPSPAAPCHCKLSRQCWAWKKSCYQPNESPHPTLLKFSLLLGSATPHPGFPSKARLSLNAPSAASCAFQACCSCPSTAARWHRPHCTACPSAPHSSSLQQGPRDDKHLCKAAQGKRRFWLEI